MKILICHSYYHPLHSFETIDGGIEQHSMQLIKSLLLQGHDIVVACTKDSTLNERDIEVIHINNNSKDGSEHGRYSHLEGYEEVAKRLSNNDFDLIISNNTSLSVIEWLSAYDLPVYQFLHHVPSGIGYQNLIARMNKLNDKVTFIAVSDYIAQQNVKSGVLKNIKVLLSTFFEHRKDLVQMPTKSLVMLGRVVNIRNITTGIEAVLNFLPDYKLHIIGSGVNHPAEIPYFNLIKTYANEHSDKIIMHGRLDQEKAHEIVRNSTALLNLCHFEAFGLAAFEAQKLGTPVVYEVKNDKLNGVSEFVRDKITGIKIDTARAGIGKRSKLVADAVKEIEFFNRKEVFSIFNKNYSLDKFSEQLEELING